jgi:polyisoprenoid-binding protein YceI
MPPPGGSYALDPVHTFAEFRVRHLVIGKVRGRFDSISGDFAITDDPEHLFGHVEVRIDAASIDTNVEARDDDLRSARFFDVENFPVIRFRGSGSSKVAISVWTVSGDLTIRHVTHPITLEVTVRGARPDAHGQVKVGLTATARATRADFELTTELMQESGDAGGPDVEIEVDVEAVLRD